MAGASTVTSLYDLAEELRACAAEAVTLGVGGPIPRTYVSPGPPAWDCELLTVHVGGGQVADTSPLSPLLQPGHRVDISLVNLFGLTVTVLRCVPGMTHENAYPPIAMIEVASKQILGDVWAIWNHVMTRHRAKTLFTGPSCSRELFVDPPVPLRPQGGLAGFELHYRVQLDGMEL